jgi:hypothetical protein
MVSVAFLLQSIRNLKETWFSDSGVPNFAVTEVVPVPKKYQYLVPVGLPGSLLAMTSSASTPPKPRSHRQQLHGNDV